MRVALFITCLNDIFMPRAGLGMVHILEHLGIDVTFPDGQTCCGQPQWNSGYQAEAEALGRHFLDVFEGADYVVSPSGSCTAMVRHTYPEMFRDDPGRLAQARALAPRVYEFTEFLTEVLGTEDLGASLKGRAAYHASCHMTRMLGVTEPPLKLLRQVRGLDLVPLAHPELCCGFGGTFAVKSPELSVAMGDDKLEDVVSSGAKILVGADPSCLLHLQGRAQRRGLPIRVMHVAELLAEGAGLL